MKQGKAYTERITNDNIDSDNSIPTYPLLSSRKNKAAVLLLGHHGEDWSLYELLSLAEDDGFKNSLDHKHKTRWFNKNTPNLFDDDGIEQYNRVTADTFQKRFQKRTRLTALLQPTGCLTDCTDMMNKHARAFTLGPSG